MNMENYLRKVASLLEEDYPSEFQKVLDLLASDAALIGIDNKRTLVTVREGRIQFLKPQEIHTVDLQIFITKSLIFELLDGKIALADAILRSDFMIKGSFKAILRFYGIVEIVLRVSQRSASFIELFNRFRYE